MRHIDQREVRDGRRERAQCRGAQGARHHSKRAQRGRLLPHGVPRLGGAVGREGARAQDGGSDNHELCVRAERIELGLGERCVEGGVAGKDAAEVGRNGGGDVGEVLPCAGGAEELETEHGQLWNSAGVGVHWAGRGSGEQEGEGVGSPSGGVGGDVVVGLGGQRRSPAPGRAWAGYPCRTRLWGLWGVDEIEW